MCSLPRNCNRLPGTPDARKRPAMCASAHEQAADKADGVPGKRLCGFIASLPDIFTKIIEQIRQDRKYHRKKGVKKQGFYPCYKPIS